MSKRLTMEQQDYIEGKIELLVRSARLKAQAAIKYPPGEKFTVPVKVEILINKGGIFWGMTDAEVLKQHPKLKRVIAAQKKLSETAFKTSTEIGAKFDRLEDEYRGRLLFWDGGYEAVTKLLNDLKEELK
jgi:hypothetical protein